MPQRVSLVFREASVTLPVEYEFGPDEDFEFASVRAKLNGAGASGTFIVVLEALSQDGKIMTQSPIDQQFAVGDTGALTWAPFLRRSAESRRGLPTVGVSDSPAGTNVPNNADTAITWTTIAFDTNAMWSAVNPTRLTCVQDGFYYITANCFWNANAVGTRRIRVRLNGGATILVGDSRGTVPTAGLQTDQAAPKSAWEAAVGDFIELVAFQDSGGALPGFFAVTVFKQSETQ